MTTKVKDMIPCTQESRISSMETVIIRMDKIINGNGQTGLFQTTIRLEENVKVLTESIKLLGTAVSGFNRFQNEIEAEVGRREKRKANRKWLIGTIITLGLGVVGLILDK